FLISIVIVDVGIDPTIHGCMTIPLAFSTLGCTLPSVMVIALGAQSGGNVNQGTKGGRYKAPIGTSIKQDFCITVVEKERTRDDVRVRASIPSSHHISSSLSYAIPFTIPMVLRLWTILLDVSCVTALIACSSLLISIVIVDVGIDPTIHGCMTIPLAFSTLGCTLPSVMVIALGAQR
nr:hypothetical protein [Tanacetum cinerariifolium]